jgi:hypothetical protein
MLVLLRSFFVFLLVFIFASRAQAFDCPAALLLSSQELPEEGAYPHTYTGVLDLYYTEGHMGSGFAFQEYRGFKSNPDYRDGSRKLFETEPIYHSLEWQRFLAQGDYVRVFNPALTEIVWEGEIGAIPGQGMEQDWFFDYYPAILFSKTAVLPR